MALAVFGMAGVAAAAGEAPPQSDTAKTSYALGYQIGGDFRRQEVDLDAVAVLRGIADARAGAEPQMSEAAMRDVLMSLKRKVTARERAVPEVVKPVAPARGGAVAAGATSAAVQAAQSVPTRAKRPAPRSNPKERAFLEANASRVGVVSLPSGLQYEVQKRGSGKQPRATDKVALIYRGALANGSEIDSSARNGNAAPRVVPLASMSAGLREAVSLMQEGSQWRVVVPPELGFDARTPLFGKVTVFDLELVAVNP